VLGIPGQVLTLSDDALRSARVQFGGIVKEVSLVYVPHAVVGDYVIVHAGFAISRIDEDEALRVFSYLDQIEAEGVAGDCRWRRPRRRAKALREVPRRVPRCGEASRLAAAIRARATRPWRIMEVCGGQTHSIVRYGIDSMLGDKVELIHGPGCPVCVTPSNLSTARWLWRRGPASSSARSETCCGVQGSSRDLLSVKAAGGDVRVVYSPLDAVKLAADNPSREVVFFAVGFETTAPANAMAVHQAPPWDCKTFPCWSRTCWCRPRSRPSCRQATAA